MMRSMYSGVSGLRVHQTKMDVIGNNIANVNTTAFKGSSVNFSEVFSQTMKGATSPAGYEGGLGGSNAQQVGLGVNISAVDINMTEGAAKRTDNSLDLKVEGDGFFVVKDDAGTKFTRAGAFRVDSGGNLVTSAGLKVCGWQVNESTKEIVKSPVKPLSILKPEYSSVSPQTTTEIGFEGNWDIQDGGEYDATFDDGSGGIPIIISFYDSLGNKFTGQLTTRFDKTDNTWKINQLDYLKNEKGNIVNDSAGNPVEDMAVGPFNIEFDVEGKIVSGTEIQTLQFSSPTIPFEGVNSTIGEQNAGNSEITLDFSNITQFKQKTSTNAVMKDGRESGSITGFSVGGDGKVTGRYSNGDVRLLGQIVLAKFRNPMGLKKMGNNLFIDTANSGSFNGVGIDPTSGGGAINSGVLEMSNVDLSKQFTEMITTQRGFQANSRIITSSDEILQELVNLKR